MSQITEKDQSIAMFIWPSWQFSCSQYWLVIIIQNLNFTPDIARVKLLKLHKIYSFLFLPHNFLYQFGDAERPAMEHTSSIQSEDTSR